MLTSASSRVASRKWSVHDSIALELYPSIGPSDVFVKPPNQGSGAQPDVVDLPHRGEERVAVGGIHTVVHGLEHPTGAIMQQRRNRGRRRWRRG